LSEPQPSHEGHHHGNSWPLTLGALGVVFGDIGTSPLYTLKECALHARLQTGGVLDRQDLFGILSLIFWAMTLVVTVKYLFFIMRADNNGEGGIFALLALVPKKMRATAARAGPRLGPARYHRRGLLYGDGYDHSGDFGARRGGRHRREQPGTRALDRADFLRNSAGAVPDSEPRHRHCG
jgi:KUP system potassium uptake protein